MTDKIASKAAAANSFNVKAMEEKVHKLMMLITN
jgi:hypothetical protein